MAEKTFEDQDLSGATFRDVSLERAAFRHVTLEDAVIRGSWLKGLRISGSELVDVDITGELRDVRVNGVDVAPLVEAELDRRHPERAKMRPTTADGFREGYDVICALWDGTVARARRLEPGLLDESVDGEWSFLETLRHLVFATDAWVRRAIEGDPAPWDPLDLPWDEMPDTPGVPRDRTARPDLDTVVALRDDRRAGVRRLLAGLTDERLASTTDPVEGEGWPPPERFPVAECLRTVLNEEWWHRQFAERDLAVLESQARAAG